MTILALESDPAQAVMIRHIVCDLVRAKLTIAYSIEQAVQALRADTPDLVLLPALLLPAEEAKLLASLRTLPEGTHVETLITPVLLTRDERAKVTPRWWHVRGARHGSIRSANANHRHLFAERLIWSLERARARPDHTEQCQVHPAICAADPLHHWAVTPTVCDDPSARGATAPAVSVVERVRALIESDEAAVADTHATLPSEDSDTVPLLTGDALDSLGLTTGADNASAGQLMRVATDRRAYQRIPARDLPRLHAARIKFGPPVSLVDVSAGGALIETETPLRPESEALLELVGDGEFVVIPFRVVRCQVSALGNTPLYAGACAFTRPLDLATLGLPNSVAAAADAAIGASEGFDLTLFKASVEQCMQQAEADTLRTTPDGPADRPSGCAERRQHVRVNGPFDGRRLGAVDVPVLIHNLSEGGCLVNSLHEAEAGRWLTLGVHVPDEDWITFQAEVVHSRPGFGFALRFIEIPDSGRACLARLVATRTPSVAPDDVRKPMAAQSA